MNPIDAELVGIGLCLGEENDDLFYIPLGHQTKKETSNQLSIEDVFSKLRNWIEDPKKEKALQNSKFDRQIFFNHGLDLKGVTFDTLLADYLLNNQEKHGLSEISFRLFGFKPPSFKETVGKNKDFSFVDIPLMIQVFRCLTIFPALPEQVSASLVSAVERTVECH